MKVLIVDDERPARERLKQMLAEHADVDTVLEASSAGEAVELARIHDPDLMLLDIAMPGVDGLSMAKDAVGLPPIIFTTAHREFAAEAFEIAALDYLLKPIKRERLAAALERARTRPSQPVWISARRGDSYEVLDALAVSRFSASDKYVVCSLDGREIILDHSLNDLEKLLVEHDFMRIHRAELINLRRVRRLRLEKRTCAVELSDGQIVFASRRLIHELRRRLGIES